MFLKIFQCAVGMLVFPESKVVAVLRNIGHKYAIAVTIWVSLAHKVSEEAARPLADHSVQIGGSIRVEAGRLVV